MESRLHVMCTISRQMRLRSLARQHAEENTMSCIQRWISNRNAGLSASCRKGSTGRQEPKMEVTSVPIESSPLVSDSAATLTLLIIFPAFLLARSAASPTPEHSCRLFQTRQLFSRERLYPDLTTNTRINPTPTQWIDRFLVVEIYIPFKLKVGGWKSLP